MQQKAEPKRTRSLSFGLERLGLTVLRYPLLAGLLVVAATVAALFGIAKLQVDDSLSELFRTDTQEFRDYEVMSERFPSSEYDVLIVVTGDIINISSTAGQKGAPVTSAYSASKAAVIGLSESLMMEVRKKNIRVTTLTPSTVATDMAVDLKLTDGNPDKVMQAEDMADLMVAQLKLHPRVVLKHAGLWSNNP